MSEIIKVRKPFSSHIMRGLLILWPLYKTVTSDSAEKIFWGVLLLVFIAVLTGEILQSSYIRLSGSLLTINEGLFSSKTINVDDIDRIEINAGLFSTSRIVLKDGKGKIKFSYYSVNEKDFEEILKRLNVPVK